MISKTNDRNLLTFFENEDRIQTQTMDEKLIEMENRKKLYTNLNNEDTFEDLLFDHVVAGEYSDE